MDNQHNIRTTETMPVIATNINTTSQTQAIPKNHDVNIWWTKARKVAPIFFELMESPLNIPPQRVIIFLLIELHNSRDRLLLLSSPSPKLSLSLWRSFSDTLTGYATILAGNNRLGRAYLESARIEYEFALYELQAQGEE
jgi:hypothetical protein